MQFRNARDAWTEAKYSIRCMQINPSSRDWWRERARAMLVEALQHREAGR